MSICDSAPDLQQHLCRLSRFGANLADAHSCFVFLPARLLVSGLPQSSVSSNYLKLAGYHSLSSDIISNPRIEQRSGLIGWVAEHRQPIHVSPFEHDSRTLGIYRNDQQLKSLIGIPIVELPRAKSSPSTGVLLCDSKKSFAFSKLQGKLLADLAAEIANCIVLTSELQERNSGASSWDDFVARAQALQEAVGRSSLEVLRVRLSNFGELEQQQGTAAAVQLLTQFIRLVKQALPPHFPLFELPTGELILALDNMMSSFYENKLRALATHLSREGAKITLEFSRRSFAERQTRSWSVADLIRGTNAVAIRPLQAVQQEFLEGTYGNRRS